MGTFSSSVNELIHISFFFHFGSCVLVMLIHPQNDIHHYVIMKEDLKALKPLRTGLRVHGPQMSIL